MMAANDIDDARSQGICSRVIDAILSLNIPASAPDGWKEVPLTLYVLNF